MPILELKCPNLECGKVYTMEKRRNMEYLSLRCPSCRQSHRYREWVNLSTDKPSKTPQNNVSTFVSQKDLETPTTPPDLPKLKKKQARITVRSTNEVITLNKEEMILGRGSDADIRISPQKRLTSRAHLKLCRGQIDGEVFYYVSLCSDRVNATFIGNDRLVFGSSRMLVSGDMIYLPDETLIFEME